jgi:hydroxypyruvate isomerase
MPRFSANITFLFRERPVAERFAAARNAGFTAVEIISPEDASVAELVAAAKDTGMHVALCNAPMGDFIEGGPGLSAVPGRQAEFRDAIDQARAMADALQCKRVHIGPSLVPAGMAWQDCYDVYLENVAYGAKQLADSDITMTIEILNSIDTPTIFLSRLEQVLRVIDEAGQPNLMLQFDVYHMSRVEDDYIALLEANIDRIGHIQIADMPGRGEPGSGELDFPAFFSLLDQLGYAGWVGAEYKPSTVTEQTLAWFEAYRGSQP